MNIESQVNKASGKLGLIMRLFDVLDDNDLLLAPGNTTYKWWNGHNGFWQAAVQIGSKPPDPSNGGLIYHVLGKPTMQTCWMADIRSKADIDKVQQD